ncbi:hypothetical protein [Paraburkholderia caffeinilytica]|uniref:hypothetical protein n=1 Tax=Paraburkholderia caffeinilytica TaxID=1761016 RepID=UPI003D9FCCA0
MNLSFSYEAKKRIAGMGAAAISAFLDDSPFAARRKVFATLPAVDGFRKNTDREFRIKGERLVAALAHAPDPKTRTASKEWKAFEAIWCAWGQQTFQHGFPSTLIDYTEAGEPGALKFLKELVDGNAKTCPKEDVERLVQFGGFAITSGVSAFVASLPSRATLERDRLLSMLPDDVRELERTVRELGKTTGDLGRKLREVETKAAGAATAAVSASQASAEMERRIDDLDHRPPALSRSELDKLTTEFTAQTKRVEHRIEQALTAARTSKDYIRDDVGSLQKALKNLAGELTAIRDSLANLEEEHQRIVCELRTRREADTASEHTAENKPEIVNSKVIAGPVKWLSTPPSTKPEALSDPSNVFQFTKANLVAIGVRQTDADSAARTMVAGVLSGQMVQFRGSLAEFLGTASTRCFGGNRQLTWQVPVGLCNGSDADSILGLLGDATQPYPGLLLRGVNCSAFEIYGGAVRDRVMQSQFVRVGRVPLGAALFATWAEGPAALPGNTALLELGPIVDSDELLWSQSPDWTVMRGGEVSFLQNEIQELIESTREQVSEVSNVVNALALPRNRLWQFAFFRFLGVLFALPGADYKRDLGIALTNWIVPWANANGLTRDVVERAIDEFASEQLQTTSVKNALSELVGEPN